MPSEKTSIQFALVGGVVRFAASYVATGVATSGELAAQPTLETVEVAE